MEEFIHSVWFKRNWLSKHDLVTKSKDEIMKLHENNKSNYLFYFFISKLFDIFKETNEVENLIQESKHFKL